MIKIIKKNLHDCLGENIDIKTNDIFRINNKFPLILIKAKQIDLKTTLRILLI